MLKSFFFNIIYFLYRSRLLNSRITVLSIDDTINELLSTNKSMVRFGDGEIALIADHDIPLQNKNSELSERMKTILKDNRQDLIVTLPDIFVRLDEYAGSTQAFYKKHLFFRRRTYENICRNKTYYNTAISRPYIEYKDLTTHSKYFEMIKPLWNQREIVFIEGAVSHNGVDNDLFDNAISIERIICPSRDAYKKYDEILNECMKLDKSKLLLITIGATSKPLVIDLDNAGYRAIDLGNLDMEYGWYLEGTTHKTPVAKHNIKTYEENLVAGYTEYLSQIIARIS